MPIPRMQSRLTQVRKLTCSFQSMGNGIAMENKMSVVMLRAALVYDSATIVRRDQQVALMDGSQSTLMSLH
jgi:hypothetical protein